MGESSLHDITSYLPGPCSQSCMGCEDMPACVQNQALAGINVPGSATSPDVYDPIPVIIANDSTEGRYALPLFDHLYRVGWR